MKNSTLPSNDTLSPERVRHLAIAGLDTIIRQKEQEREVLNQDIKKLNAERERLLHQDPGSPLPSFDDPSLGKLPVTIKKAKKRRVSKEGRKRMAEAQQKRRAAERGQTVFPEFTDAGETPKSLQKRAKKRHVSPESRAKMAAAAKKRWARLRKQRGKQ